MNGLSVQDSVEINDDKIKSQGLNFKSPFRFASFIIFIHTKVNGTVWS